MWNGTGTLEKEFEMLDVTDKHIFFYKEWPSNFYKSLFKYTSMYDGVERMFFCSEQAFMHEKAVFFGDFETAGKILEAQSPMTAKELGRQVRNFDDDAWEQERYKVMVEVNYAKYSQNMELRTRLLDPEFDGKTFVEASPVDGIWGILMPQGTDGIDDEANWRGRNLLGKAITEVRNRLMTEDPE